MPAGQRAGNYVITKADEIDRGGAKAKFRQNVGALYVLRRHEKARAALPVVLSWLTN